MCNFYIGQKVVYVGKDRGFDLNPGKTIHTIRAMRQSTCKCSTPEIDVGIRTTGRPYDCVCCNYCGHTHYEKSYVTWKSANNFRPLIEDFTEEEIESVNISELVEPLYEPT